MFQITRKTYLAKNLKRLQKLFPKEFDFIPRTWVIPNEYHELKTAALERRKRNKSTMPTRVSSKPENILEMTAEIEPLKDVVIR